MTSKGIEEYKGQVVLPSEQDARQVSLTLDTTAKKASLKFNPAVEGVAEWTGEKVAMTPRLKYTEVVFQTTTLPKEGVTLVWKFNVSGLDNTVAGVITVKPNPHRITGERGFVLSRPVRT